MSGVAELAWSVVSSLIASAIGKGVSYASQNFFQRKKIQSRIDRAIAQAVEPLLPFLSNEGVTDEQQRLLIQVCGDELGPLAEDPAELYKSSLDGQKIFDRLYGDRALPQAVVDEQLSNVYTLLFPRIAMLLCRIPPTVKQWESEAWPENFRRLDEIAVELGALFVKVDALVAAPGQEADRTLNMVRRNLAQRIGMDLDLTGLRADRPMAGKLDDFFVHPKISRSRERDDPIVVANGEDSMTRFVRAPALTVVVGAPGAGKSTWSRWLQREASTHDWSGVPVRVELRSLSSDALPSLHDLVRETAGPHLSEEATADRIRRWVDAQQVLFILDGFDEIRPQERDVVQVWFEDLQRAAPGCPFVLTSRPLTTQHINSLSKTWHRWEMQPFDEPRIIDYIERWYAHTPLAVEGSDQVDPGSLARKWGGDPTIGPLTGNPLLLSTLLMVHHLDGNLPNGRAKLYQRYVHGMLGLWDDRRKVAADIAHLTADQKRQLLRALAVQMHLGDHEQLDETDMTDLMEQTLNGLDLGVPAESVLADLRERSGLIAGPGTYGFVHKSVAEYLVAEAAVQGDQHDADGQRLDRFALFSHRDDDRWNTVTFLWAGLAPVADVESFIQECNEAGNLSLGYGVLADQFERIPRETKRELMVQLAAEEISDTESRHRITAVCSAPAQSPVALPLGYMPLRGLGPASVFPLLQRSVAERVICWPDVDNSRGEMRKLLWVVCIAWPCDVDAWRACLAAEMPDDWSRDDQLLLAAQWSLHRSLIEPCCSDPPTLVRAIGKARPDYKRDLPLCLMSAVCASATDRQQPVCVDRLAQVAELLGAWGDGSIESRWLALTGKWTIEGPGIHLTGDLLEQFVHCLHALAAQGKIASGETLEGAVSFVEGLERRRQELLDRPRASSP